MIRSLLPLLGISVLLLAMVGRGLRSSESAPATEWPSAIELDSLRRYLEPVQATHQLADHKMFVPAQPLAPEMTEPVPSGESPPPAASPTARWVVDAVLVTDRSRHAIINDTPVSVGDTLPGGARVTGIETDRVMVAERGRMHVLRVARGDG